MGKKNKPDLGKSIIKHRAKTGGNIKHANSWLHCSELDDDAGPNLSSITEQSALDDFLATAELAGTEFAAEKLNTTIVTPRHNEGLLNSETTDAIKQAQKENQHFLRIPRRPEWDQNMTTEELDQKERDTFLQWRRQLAELQEKEHILLTPFERNLDFWRQLWRVIERSDVVVQIVDARNPLLYRCEDLENYVTEVDPKKCNLLLINKADFLTSDQRDMWARYFRSVGLRVAFWSAQLENERLTAMNTSDDSDQEEKKEENEAEENSDESDVKVLPRFSEMSFEENTAPEEQLESLDPTSAMETKTTSSGLQPSEEEEQRVSPSNSRSRDSERLNEDVIVLSEGFSCIPEDDMTCDATSLLTNDKKPVPEQELIVQSDAAQTQEQCTNYDRLGDERTVSETSSDGDGEKAKHCPGKAFESNRAQVPEDQHLCNTDDMDSDFPGKILTKDELLALFKMIHLGREQRSTAETETMLTTVGLVGYPNVGKSSTINTLLNDKKVPVSATPGRTKHFQTLYVNDEVLLCDCPGLVFPSFVSTKADMILNGILPIDQMRDHVAPVSLVCQRIPRDALETAYGINIPPPEEGEDPNRAPYADELLNAYGYIRGFMTSHGIPDCSRSSRYVLKDYVKGKLLFCIAPPGENDEDFQQIGCNVQEYADVEGKVKKVQGTGPKQMSNVDKDFFKQEQVRCFSRGIHVTGRPFSAASTAQAAGEQGAVPLKPWKKHYNRNKREKLRRLAKK